MIARLQRELNSAREENKLLKDDNAKRKDEAQLSNKMKTEACAVVIKLDEARVAMNRLLGPQGPLSQSERHKFLSSKDSDFPVSQPKQEAKLVAKQLSSPRKATFGAMENQEGDGEDDFWY